MAGDRVCCDLGLFIGLLFLILPGCCAAADPVLQLEPFTSTAICPVDEKDKIQGQVHLDLTGVTKADYTESVSINRVPPSEMARAKFNPCGVVSSLDLLCVEDDGNEHYVFNLTQTAERTYSGSWFHAMIFDVMLVGFKNSSLVRYPLIKYGPVQSVFVDGEAKSLTSDYDMKFEIGDTSKTLNVTYSVSGIEWTGDYRVSILDKSMNELEFSTSSVHIEADIPGSTTVFYVSYHASPSHANTCNHTIMVTISGPTTTTITTPTTTTITTPTMTSTPAPTTTTTTIFTTASEPLTPTNSTSLTSLSTPTKITTTTSTPTTSSSRTVETTTGGTNNTKIGSHDGESGDDSGCGTLCTVLIILLVILILAVCIVLAVLFYRHKKACISVNCNPNINISRLEQLLREHLKMRDAIANNPHAVFIFYHPGTRKESLNKDNDGLENLMPNSDLGRLVTVDMKWKWGENSSIHITIRDIKNCTSDTVEMETRTSEKQITEKTSRS